MKKMIRLSVSGNHSQLTILLYLVSFDLSSILSKFWPNCLEKVKCPDGHLRLPLAPCFTRPLPHKNTPAARTHTARLRSPRGRTSRHFAPWFLLRSGVRQPGYRGGGLPQPQSDSRVRGGHTAGSSVGCLLPGWRAGTGRQSHGRDTEAAVLFSVQHLPGSNAPGWPGFWCSLR